MREQAQRLREQHEQWAMPPAPFDWGNPWYYRGY
jgi:hypothetical protein